MRTNLTKYGLCFFLGVVVSLSIPYAFSDVTNTEAVALSNSMVRPVAEELRATYYRMLAVKNQYGGRLNTLFPAGGGNIVDGRTDATQITADDARTILLFANTYITAYETSGVAAMTKPCVRPMEVN